MKCVLLSTFLFLHSHIASAFIDGLYEGKSSTEVCQMSLKNVSQGVAIEYHCVSNDGMVFETSGPQLYAFGSTSNQYQDDSGTYLVTTFGNSQKLEYKIVKLSDNNSTWLESINQKSENQIHFGVSLDDQFLVDMDLKRK